MESHYTEADIQQALNAIANGTSQRKAGLEYGVLPSTLRDRMNSILSRVEAYEHK
jgi:hypothetical protein